MTTSDLKHLVNLIAIAARDGGYPQKVMPLYDKFCKLLDKMEKQYAISQGQEPESNQSEHLRAGSEWTTAEASCSHCLEHCKKASEEAASRRHKEDIDRALSALGVEA